MKEETENRLKLPVIYKKRFGHTNYSMVVVYLKDKRKLPGTLLKENYLYPVIEIKPMDILDIQLAEND